MWYSISASRLASFGHAFTFAAAAAVAAAAIKLHAEPAATDPDASLVQTLLAVSVNRERQPEPIIALRDEAGRTFIAAADLVHWRLRLPAAAPTVFQAEPYYPLSAFSGLVATVHEQEQTLVIEAPAALFVSTQIDVLATPAAEPQRAGAGGFLNYTVLATRVDSVTTAAGSFELAGFSRWGVATTSAVATASAGRTEFTRLESTWTFAMPDRRATVRAGDTVSRAGAWGRSLRYGGVQYATDFATQPNLVLSPGQFVAGQATVPSTVDLFVNNALVTQQAVQPGPFSIYNIPPITGPGNVTLVIRDELGREQLITRPFYASPALLRVGLADFSCDLGWVRRDFGVASDNYGSWLASGTYRQGLSDRWTGEVRVEAQARHANVGIASDVLVGDVGVISASVAGGHNPAGTGASATLGFDRQSRAISFGIRGTAASPYFRQVGGTGPEFVLAREWLASASWVVGRYGTVGVAHVARSYRDRPSVSVSSLGYSLSLERYGEVGVSMSRVRSDERSTLFNATWTLAFGGPTSVTSSIDRVRSNAPGADHTERSVSIERNLPAGEGFGYRLRASDQGQRNAQIDYQNQRGSYSLEVAQAQGRTGERVSASGGIGLIADKFFVSRAIEGSFGLVQLPGYPKVRVYSQNQEVGRTDAAGDLIVPRLLPYQKNTVRVEQADLPFDAEFNVLALDAIPYARSGVVVKMFVRPARGALVRIMQEGGTPVPAGAQVRIDGQTGSFPVALDGDAYLTGLSALNHAVVTWPDQECTFDFVYPDTDDPQPRLGPFQCSRQR